MEKDSNSIEHPQEQKNCIMHEHNKMNKSQQQNQIIIKDDHDNSQQQQVIQKKSKKQIKKQLKKEKWEQDKLIKRKQKKQKEKQKKQLKKLVFENNQKQFKQVNQIQGKQMKNQQTQNLILMKKRRQDYQEKMKEGLNVVIDLQFFDLMNQKQLNSLVKQLGYCHAVNRKVQKPFNFILTSTTEERKQFIDKKYNGNKWGISMLQNAVHLQFNINKLVYLTGDAQQTIDYFDEDLIYIIGGIVDHNRLKKITYNYANQHKIITRKLPLQGVKLKTNVHLAVNHVWEWMLKKYNGSSWKQALQSVLPTRKIFKQIQQ